MTELLPNIFAIEVPEGFNAAEDIVERYMDEALPDGEFHILFTTKGVSEEQAKQAVDRQLGNGKFKDYECVGSLAQFGEYIFSTATESIHSLLRSKGLMGANYLLIRKVG